MPVGYVCYVCYVCCICCVCLYIFVFCIHIQVDITNNRERKVWCENIKYHCVVLCCVVLCCVVLCCIVLCCIVLYTIPVLLRNRVNFLNTFLSTNLILRTAACCCGPGERDIDEDVDVDVYPLYVREVDRG